MGEHTLSHDIHGNQGLKEGRFFWLWSQYSYLVLYLDTVKFFKKSKISHWQVRLRYVNYECKTLRRFRKRIELEQDIEIFGALTEVEMAEEGTAARKINIRKNTKVREVELAFTIVSHQLLMKHMDMEERE